MKAITIPVDGPCALTDDGLPVVFDLVTHVIDGPITALRIPSDHPVAPGHHLLISEEFLDSSRPVNQTAMRFMQSCCPLPAAGFLRGDAVLLGPDAPIGGSVRQAAIDFLLHPATLQ